MLLNILSDLHLLKRHQISNIHSDVAILAGDIAENPYYSMDFGRYSVPQAKNIIQIAGNHDYIDHHYDSALEILSSNSKHNHFFLEDACCIIDKDIPVKFIGSTLWTDFSLFEDSKIFIDKYKDHVHDFHRMKSFLPEDWLKRHYNSKEFILDTLSSSFIGTNVVIHHHLTDMRSVHQQFKDSCLTPAYAMSGMEELFTHSKCSLIVHGHTHNSTSWRYDEKSPLVVCNPMGGFTYHQGNLIPSNVDFNPDLCVEINKQFIAEIKN